MRTSQWSQLRTLRVLRRDTSAIAKMKKGKVSVLVALVALYLFSYLGIRNERILIHRMSFSGLVSKEYKHHHWIEASSQSSPFRAIAARSSQIFFAPLRWLESLAWHMIPREYSLRSGGHSQQFLLHSRPVEWCYPAAPINSFRAPRFTRDSALPWEVKFGKDQKFIFGRLIVTGLKGVIG